MDLLSLRHFQLVARFEHISRAAAELRVAQPSVSRTIARLEAELGVPLFDRRGGVKLNEHGRLFLHHVERALGELDGARRALQDTGGQGVGTITVATETLLTLTGMLTRFRAVHPQVKVALFQSSATEMARQLRAGEVDFCIASQPLAGTSLETVELMDDEVLLAIPWEHRLAGRESVRIEELAMEPFVTTRVGYWPRALLDKLFAAEGLTPTISCEGDEMGASPYLVSAGLGMGLIPAMSLEVAGPQPAATWARVDAEGCRRVLSLVWRRDAYLSAAAEGFKALATATPFAAPRPF